MGKYLTISAGKVKPDYIYRKKKASSHTSEIFGSSFAINSHRILSEKYKGLHDEFLRITIKVSKK